MLAFNNDYSHGAHPAVLQALVDTNMEPQPGYGTDAHTERAKQLIREACQAPDADVFFLVGGTQANATVIDMLLAPYEGVVAAETGHVACHEAGAIEFGGHKVLTIPGYEGKMHAEDLENYIQVFYENESYEHTVFPGAVYVSLSTEYGTLYSKAELAAIHAVCQKREIPLFVDGARLAYALAADECDITLPELAQLCDVFYIGGAKCGALCGEAVVFCGMHAPAHPIPRIKQHGALLAKGRLTGVQFEALFTDGLYSEIGRQAIETAQALRRVLHERGYQFFLETGAGRPLLLGEKGCMTEMSEPTIRLATPGDAPALLAIYEPYVRQTAITCEYEVPSVEEFAGRIERTLKRYPYLVMELDGRPVGYAYVSPLNSREAYDWSVETSIYLARDVRHGGLGRKLHDALKQCLIAMGITNMCALIAVPHDKDDEYLTHNSQDFHAHMGYRLVGAFDRCAQKFGRWYDMCWMELVLAERVPNQPKPTWFPDLPKPTI